MAERTGNLREELIRAGIDEINIHGANGFSIRRSRRRILDVLCGGIWTCHRSSGAKQMV